MIDIFEALGWLNAIGNDSCLNDELRRQSKNARNLIQFDSRVRSILERLRNAAYSSNDPLEKAEILLHCAVIEYCRRCIPQAACDAKEAVIAYENAYHHRAVALWILGIVQWEMFQSLAAYQSWTEAKGLFRQQQILFQNFPYQAAWYKNILWRMNVELAAQPEEIMNWLNCFEGSSLGVSPQQILKSVKKKISQQSYPTIYVLTQDFEEANKRSRGEYERAEIYLEFGLAFYQMGNIHFAIKLLRKSVHSFFPGIGSCHKQAVARWLLGAVEWMNEPSQNQAIADWTQSIREFEELQSWAVRDNNPQKKNWYAERKNTLEAALSERLV